MQIAVVGGAIVASLGRTSMIARPADDGRVFDY